MGLVAQRPLLDEAVEPVAALAPKTLDVLDDTLFLIVGLLNQEGVVLHSRRGTRILLLAVGSRSKTAAGRKADKYPHYPPHEHVTSCRGGGPSAAHRRLSMPTWPARLEWI